MNPFHTFLTLPRLAIAVLFSVLLVSQSSYALLVCLYARSTGEPTNGHAFVTVEDNSGRVYESYGYWPKSKYSENPTINLLSDQPLRVIAKHGRLTETLKRMHEARLCQPMGGIRVDQVRKTAYQYREVRGDYRVFSNNCSHFATTLYNAVSRDSFPESATPGRIIREVKKLSATGARSYQEYRNMGGR